MPPIAVRRWCFPGTPYLACNSTWTSACCKPPKGTWQCRFAQYATLVLAHTSAECRTVPPVDAVSGTKSFRLEIGRNRRGAFLKVTESGSGYAFQQLLQLAAVFGAAGSTFDLRLAV